ncbi:helix-turn-helix domain-containing protein [Nonomuraea angiospora]|uniref:Sugar diacid utilization regulator n=1 Tax=Nonomuraea angiospora TaxID=46172 RepID=A0ABR9LXH8_9ACTN|nr:GAF domain-containing protein [Nonomuraea angiospora]MBE1585349.1 sugar diacid utilization regulator [Nonomuraea angiospora]
MDGEDATELRSWLAAVSALTAAVNAGRGLRDVLDLVAATARELLGLDFCGVLVPDPAERNLVIAGWSGLTEEYVARVNSDRPVRLEADASGGAPSSRAYRSGRPCAVADISREPDFIWGGVAREQGYRSMLSVPLVTASGVIGTLNSYRSAVHEFGREEVDRLQLLAEHAALAISSARVLDDLRDQRDLVMRSEEIHERLLRVAVRAGGVEGIAGALHDLLGAPVLVQGIRGELLAQAGHPPTPEGLLDAGRPPTPESPPTPEDLLDAGAGPLAPEAGLVRERGPHVVADVVLEGEVAARVWVPGRAGALAPLDRRALEHASIVLSLELLRRRTALEVEQNLRGDLLADLLAGADPMSPSVRDRAGLLGHDLARDHLTLVAQVTAGGRPAPAGAIQRALAEAVALAAGVRPRPLVAVHRDVIVALWPVAATGPAAGRPAGDALRRSVRSARGVDDATVAVSDPAQRDVLNAYRTARGALTVAGHAGRSGSTITLDDLGVAGLLLQLGDPVRLRAYAGRTLGALIRYDHDHGAALLRTLRTYLDSGMDRHLTARALTLHPNTVSQRLRRIEALTGLDLRSSQAVVDARAALIVLDVAEGADAARDRA